MGNRIKNLSGASTIEYIFVILIIMGVLIVMKPHIFGSLGGNWKKTGDAFSFGRLYDPKRTTE